MYYYTAVKCILFFTCLVAVTSGKQTLSNEEDDSLYYSTQNDEDKREHSCLEHDYCSLFNEVCKDGICVCKDGYTDKNTEFPDRCTKCPGQGEFCGDVKCCYPPGDYSCSQGVCRWRGPRYSIHMNALMIFQAIFGIAFIFALIALTLQCCRTLWGRRKLTQLQQRQRAARIGIERHCNLPTTDPSLAGRDLPPKYDDLQHIYMEKPPSYQEAIPSNFSNEAVVWPSTPPTYNDSSQNIQQGADNPTFVTDNGGETSPHTNISLQQEKPQNDDRPENSPNNTNISNLHQSDQSNGRETKLVSANDQKNSKPKD